MTAPAIRPPPERSSFPGVFGGGASTVSVFGGADFHGSHALTCVQAASVSAAASATTRTIVPLTPAASPRRPRARSSLVLRSSSRREDIGGAGEDRHPGRLGSSAHVARGVPSDGRPLV